MTSTLEIPAYFNLLRTIGIPGIIDGRQTEVDSELLRIARLNKIALLYSTAVNIDGYHKDLILRRELLTKTLNDVCSIFNKNRIKYCIFKTIKPFPTTPSDIDVLLSQEDFGEAETLLTSSGYRKRAHDSYSSTLEKEMVVDLQLQPSVSNMPYLPRTILMQNTVIKSMNGCNVRTLSPDAELIAIASHSFYKEQMLTLNDYYAITMLAEQVDSQQILDLATRAKVLEVIRMVVGLCSQITESVFNAQLEISKLGIDIGASYVHPIQTMPLKFAFASIIKLLISRASKDEEMRRSVVPAIIRIASPRQLRRLISHMMRSTY